MSAGEPPAGPRVLLVVSAASGAGKTTLLERLLPRLVAAGLRVAAIKRTHHDVDLDPPGKDSRRLRDAGATPVILQGPRTTTVFAPTPAPASTARGDDDDLAPLVTAAAAFGPLDLVVVEGGRSLARRARIEVVAAGGHAVSDPASLIAIAAATANEAAAAAPRGVPGFARDDVDGVAACVVTWTRRAQSPTGGKR